MHFKIFMSAVTHPTTLQDWNELVRLLVESAGHRADYEFGSYVGNYCYVFFENDDPSMRQLVKALRERGCPYVFIATETITGTTFNNLIKTGDEHRYTDRDYWQQRFNRFLECVQGAQAVWCGKIACESYQKLLPGVPVVPFPFPHFPNYPRLAHRQHKEFDFHFSAAPTPYRTAILDRLAERYRICSTDTQQPGYLRRDYVARSKICLNIMQGPGWRYPSTMRHWYYLNNACLVVSENCEIRGDLDPYLVGTSGEQMVDVCGQLLASDEWRRLAAMAYEKFAAECPGRPAAEQLLDLTFSRRH